MRSIIDLLFVVIFPSSLSLSKCSKYSDKSCKSKGQYDIGRHMFFIKCTVNSFLEYKNDCIVRKGNKHIAKWLGRK